MLKKFALVAASLFIAGAAPSATATVCLDECKNECVFQCMRFGGSFEHCVDVQCAQVTCRR